jgi:hypothetical protein
MLFDEFLSKTKFSKIKGMKMINSLLKAKNKKEKEVRLKQ